MSSQSITGFCIGAYQTCALNNANIVKCFGTNWSGKLGVGDEDNRGYKPNQMGENLPPIDYGSGLVPVNIVCGGDHTCIRFSSNATKCWGLNDRPFGQPSGELVTGDAKNRGLVLKDMGNNLPFGKWGTGRSVKKLVAGYWHTCALLDNNVAKCAGANQYGQLGMGDSNPRGFSAQTVGENLPSINFGSELYPVDIFTSGVAFHSCAILSDAKLKCWGANEQGQLGLGDTNLRGDSPNQMGDFLPNVNLGQGRTAVQVLIGARHTCVFRDNKSVVCWGSGEYGQLINGKKSMVGSAPNQMGIALVPLKLGTGRKAVQVATGQEITCVFLDNAAIKCFGLGESGALGQGSTKNLGFSQKTVGAYVPRIDLGVGLVVDSIHTGYDHVCVVFKDSDLIKCWGGNDVGQLGLGDKLNRGDKAGDMGANLSFTFMFHTPAPTLSPTTPTIPVPTQSPVIVCAHPNQKSCKKDTGCMWREGACGALDCTSFASKKLCDKRQKCLWLSGTCIPRPIKTCAEILNKKACMRRNICAWEKNQCIDMVR